MSGSLGAIRASRRRLVIFSLLVVVSVLLLAVSETRPVMELRRGISFAVAPVQGTLASGTRSVTQVLGALADIDTLRRANVVLQAEVDRLEDELAALESVREQNARLNRVLKTRDATDHETVVATVIGRQGSQFERVLTLDQGKDGGVAVGNPVLSEGGALAGQIIEAGDGFSVVRLINDGRSLVIGRDQRTRTTGEVIGRLSAPLAMTDIPATREVEIGDRVITAGLDGGKRFRSQYPPGLPIGRIVDIERESESIVLTALIEPEANLDSIEAVLIITDHKGPKRPVEEPAEGS